MRILHYGVARSFSDRSLWGQSLEIAAWEFDRAAHGRDRARGLFCWELVLALMLDWISGLVQARAMVRWCTLESDFSRGCLLEIGVNIKGSGSG